MLIPSFSKCGAIGNSILSDGHCDVHGDIVDDVDGDDDDNEFMISYCS